MRLLRWKSRYNTGHAETDQGNKKFVACINQLMKAADEQEHCQEMDSLLSELGQEVIGKLSADNVTAQGMRQVFYAQLIEQLPLDTYSSPACHQCGLCDLAQQQLARHLQASMLCLNESIKKN